MEHYGEPARRIPIKAMFDVLVAGGGPAGFSAAVSAARSGASTLLVEQSGCLGGVATSGLMSHWTGETRGGFYEEILARSSVPGGGSDMGRHGNASQLIDHERLKLVMLDMLEESGAKLQLYSFAAGVIQDDSRVRGIITESKSGREAIMAKITVDASGDGDIAAMAGVPFHKGREGDGKTQPMTIMLQLGGVDTGRVRYVHGFEDSYDIPSGDIQSLARLNIPHPAGHALIYPSPLPGVVTLNMTNAIDFDGTNVDDLTKADRECRNQIPYILKFLKDQVPGFENAFLLKSASAIGVRETRHFKGLKTITEHDILDARIFDDWVVTKAHFNFDVHNLSGAGLDETGVQKRFAQRYGYTIPYGCLVPEGTDGLLLAGRNISGTHLAHSNFRVMPICANIGQAAGIAAALCVEHGIQPRELPAECIQEVLSGLGVQP